MDIERDETDERQARFETQIARLREAEKRSLLKRGIELWTRTERLVLQQPASRAAAKRDS